MVRVDVPREDAVALQFRIVTTRLGELAFVFDERGLRRVLLPQPAGPRGLRAAVKREFPAAREDSRLAPRLAGQLQRYFDGERIEFDVQLNLEAESATEFRRAVWLAFTKFHTANHDHGDPGAPASSPRAPARSDRHALQPLPDHHPLPSRARLQRLPGRLFRPGRYRIQAASAGDGRGNVPHRPQGGTGLNVHTRDVTPARCAPALTCAICSGIACAWAGEPRRCQSDG